MHHDQPTGHSETTGRKRLKGLAARHASRWRSTRHLQAHLLFPGQDFHTALTRVTYRKIFGCWPNLAHPETISEKLCWLKINDRRVINAVVADKWRMRAHVEACGYGDWLNEVIAVYRDPDEIDFRALPEAWAMKVSNGSSWNIIRKPGQRLDVEAARRKLRRWCNTNWADHKGEWYYADSPSRIVVNKYLDHEGVSIDDYKLFTFNGRVRIVQYCTGRFGNLQTQFLFPDWTPAPFMYKTFNRYTGPGIGPPHCLGAMIDCAQTVAAPLPLARVDFYLHSGRPVLGEITINPAAGYTNFTPDIWNREIGSWLTLPNHADLREG